MGKVERVWMSINFVLSWCRENFRYIRRQRSGFSSGHVWMWELDCEESWAPKNWCFWTVVLEKALESPLDCKENQPVHSKGDQSWVFFGRNDAKAETLVFWPPHAKSWLTGKTLMLGGIGGRRRRGRQRMRWLDGITDSMDVSLTHEFGQGGLVCYNSWGHKELDTTERLNWTELRGQGGTWWWFYFEIEADSLFF